MSGGDGLFEVDPAAAVKPETAPTVAVKKTFRAVVPDQMLMLSPSLDEWLPEGHLARFVAELVDEVLDLGPILASYTEKRGFPPYDPRLMVRLLIYEYTTGVRSSRAIERKCTDDVAFRYLAAGAGPDYRSISRFRARHLDALAGIFTQSLRLAQRLGMVKMGRVALDGTKLQANASKHKAMSYNRLVEKEERLEAEIAGLEAAAAGLLADAEALDAAEDERFGPDGKDTDLPAELDRRESAWPGCRPPARRSRPRPPRRPAITPRTRSGDAKSVPGPTNPRRWPKPATWRPKPRGRRTRRRPTSPTPNRAS